jgi:hypothetical protein
MGHRRWRSSLPLSTLSLSLSLFARRRTRRLLRGGGAPAAPAGDAGERGYRSSPAPPARPPARRSRGSAFP